MTRRDFCAALGAGAAGAVVSGCGILPKGPCVPKVGLQLWSIWQYVDKVGLARALRDVAAIGFEGVEFAGYAGCDAERLHTLLGDAGLAACGTHVRRDELVPERISQTCEFNLTYGNSLIVCSGWGNMPPGVTWQKQTGVAPTREIDDFTKRLCAFYDDAADRAAKFGCRIGIHNHLWEFAVRMTDGTPFWDYFFSHTDKAVCMELDVGWARGAGFDPCEQFRKYPHRSPSFHAKENGAGGAVTRFDGILGKPGEPGAAGVDWERVIRAAQVNDIEWYVVECEKHLDDLTSVKPSYAFLKDRLDAIL